MTNLLNINIPSNLKDFKSKDSAAGGGIGDPVKLVNVIKTEYQYKYNGKEYQDELNLNVYDFHARVYDPTIGRTWQMDPHAELYAKVSPYNYAFNNPVFFIDPDGMKAEPPPGFNEDSWQDETGYYYKWGGFDNTYQSGDNTKIYDTNLEDYQDISNIGSSSNERSKTSSSNNEGSLITTTSTTRMENNVMIDIQGIAKVYTATDNTVGNAGVLNIDKSINVSDGSATLSGQLNTPVWQGSLSVGSNGMGTSSNLSISGNGVGTTVDSTGITFSGFSNGGNGFTNSFNVQVKPGGMAIGLAVTLGVIFAPQFTIPVILAVP